MKQITNDTTDNLIKWKRSGLLLGCNSNESQEMADRLQELVEYLIKVYPKNTIEINKFDKYTSLIIPILRRIYGITRIKVDVHDLVSKFEIEFEAKFTEEFINSMINHNPNKIDYDALFCEDFCDNYANQLINESK